jgi:RHS repeat-associated protein
VRHHQHKNNYLKINLLRIKDHDAHGVPLSVTPAGAPTSSLGYNGEFFDADLGMIYLRARWYNPSTGRFHTRDPYQGTFEDPMSMQAYLFAHGDPESMIDPSGNFSLLDFFITNGLIKLQNYTQQYVKTVDYSGSALKELGSLIITTNLAATAYSALEGTVNSKPSDWHKWIALDASLLWNLKYQFDERRKFRKRVDEAEQSKNLAPIAKSIFNLSQFATSGIRRYNDAVAAGLPTNRKMNGYPEFTPFTEGMIGTVPIKLTGDHDQDVNATKARMLLPPLDSSVNWHHHEVLGLMQAVTRRVHSGTGHYGGKSIYRMIHGDEHYRTK